MSLDDLPKKTQYMILDSHYVTGSNNTFSYNLTLESNTHIEDMGRVIGRSGRTATALRTVITSINGGRGVRVDFLDVAER